ncbi:type II secretion system protein GspC [Thalassotalea profundi]|uniref:Type II secretion system protein GspC n=1 Tax=Thalassotalea profundi TaxID=2036687 RepID=A0ABQ3J077_9GAMM|nr:type II secretion system protein GspC [Thalassotalea profundi]GHE99802.1 type II secretion system protein GspC [Thalassotalea profundi]
MPFPNSWTELNNILIKVPQQKLAKILSILLLIYIAFLAAKTTWLLFDTNETSMPVNFVASNFEGQEQASVNLSAIKQLNLFGEYNKSAQAIKVQPEEVQDAPETKLNLTLTGAVASDNSDIAAAIIENNGKQETYGIDEQITGTRATLSKVFNDRVLIKVNGKLETLMLDGFEYNKNTRSNIRQPKMSSSRAPSTIAQSSFTAPNIVDQRDNESLSESVQQLKDDLNENPGKIIDYLRISPKRQGGNIVGYSLMPGKNGEFFTASGLKAGDVAVQINGYDLTVPSNAAQALQELQEQSEVSLLVDRDGDMTEILFSIN